MLDDAPWTWGSTGGWSSGMPEFFQDMPGGVMDNIYEDLDDSPVSWNITEVCCNLTCLELPDSECEHDFSAHVHTCMCCVCTEHSIEIGLLMKFLNFLCMPTDLSCF